MSCGYKYIGVVLASLLLFSCAHRDGASDTPSRSTAIDEKSTSVLFGTRRDRSPGWSGRLESSTSYQNSRNGVEYRTVTVEVVGTYSIVNESTGTFVVQSLEIRDSGEDVESPYVSIRDVSFGVNLETREVIRNDGKPVEYATGKTIQNVTGNPSIRKLRASVLAEKTIAVGQWLDVPVSVFNESHYVKLGFTSARYQITTVSGPAVEWQLQVSGNDGKVDLFETLSVETLQATKGRSQGALEGESDGQSTSFVFEAKYQVRPL